MSRKRAIPLEPAASQISTNDNARPPRPTRKRLKSSVLEELWSIWRAYPRVPSVESRRAWASSRNADPRLVDNWFLRRRTCAKKMGEPIPDGSYDLLALEREQSSTPVNPELDSPSDDTLVYPPDGGDLNDLEASSDIVFDEDTFIELKGIETSAYNEVAQRSRPKQRRVQSKPSSVDLYAAEDRFDEDASFPVCNQGWGGRSAFTCVLCSTKSAQGTADEVLSDSGAVSDFDSSGNSTVPCLRLDFSPDTLSELSAIPFLFRTPSTVPPDNAIDHPSVNNWTTANELGYLVNDGKLDFSFLDAPHLACMELRD